MKTLFTKQFSDGVLLPYSADGFFNNKEWMNWVGGSVDGVEKSVVNVRLVFNLPFCDNEETSTF